MKFSQKQLAVIALCVVALSFSLLNVSVRMLGTGFSPFTQVYLRIGLGFLLVSFFFRKEINLSNIKKTKRNDWLILLAMGTFGYGFSVDCVTLGVLHTKLLNAAVIGSTTPFFVLLFSVIFWRKTFPLSLILFLLLTFYGVMVIATGSLIPTLNNFGVGDIFVALYAAGVGVFIVGRKMLSSHLNNSEIAFLIMGIAFITTFISAFFTKDAFQFSGFSHPVALAGLLMGGTLNVVATKLQNFSYPYLPAVTASQILLLTNVFALIFGYVFYHELVQPVEYIGAFFVLIGVWACIKKASN